jgi:methionine sulfoxide reductase heme-binding subunit
MGFTGWRVFWAATALLGIMALAMLAWAGWDADGYRLVIRATARTSLGFFLAAFGASALVSLHPGAPFRWLRRNRRYLGLAFAMSHAIHLAAIVALANADAALFWTLTNPASVVAGSLGYVAIALLAATSFDRMVALLGSRAWRGLHKAGIWFIWLSFVFTNGKRIAVSPWYAVPVVILFGAAALRIRAGRRLPGA